MELGLGELLLFSFFSVIIICTDNNRNKTTWHSLLIPFPFVWFCSGSSRRLPILFWGFQRVVKGDSLRPVRKADAA
jgi:hypothetical protein